MARAKNIIVNTVLIVASSLAGFLIMEFVIAFALPQPVIHATAPDIFFVRYDPELGWANREGASGPYQPHPDFPAVMVQINGQGIRGRPFPEQKPEGAKRIMILGDSNTFGYGVKEEDRFSDLLSNRLLHSYESLNFGVFGYGTDQEALLFEKKGILYQPDIVVLGFSAGDLSDNMNSINVGYNKPFFKIEGNRLVLHNTPVPEYSPYMKSVSRRSPVKNFFYRHSHIYRLVLKRLVSLNLYGKYSVSEMSEDEGMNVTLAIINATHTFCRSSGCRLVVLLISNGIWIDALREDRDRRIGYYDPLKHHLGRLGIPVIDTTDRFIEYDNREDPAFFPNDPVHITVRGNELVAESLYDGLIQYGLIHIQ